LIDCAFILRIRITIPSTAYLQANDATSNCNGNNNNGKNVKNPASNYSVRINCEISTKNARQIVATTKIYTKKT